jgi:hypothetical protein
MGRRLVNNIAAAVVVIALQMTASMMSLRRDPLVSTEGQAISAMLWYAVARRTEELTREGGGPASTSP